MLGFYISCQPVKLFGSRMRNFILEFIGTFFLVLVIGLTGSPVAAGLIYGAMIYLNTGLHAGHYNPAVSLSVLIIGKINFREFILITAAQIAGAFFAALVIFIFRDVAYYPSPGINIHFVKTVLCELLFTFILCMVFLKIVFDKKFTGNKVYGIIIGMALIAIMYAGGPVSGGVFNPATGIGTALFDIFITGEGIKYILIYLIGPFAGSALAGFLFNYLK